MNDFRDALYIFGKFRCGVEPLKIWDKKTGRYEFHLIENKICLSNNIQINIVLKMKNMSSIWKLRQYSFNHVYLYNNELTQLSDAAQFIFDYLFTNENMRYYSAKICYEISMRKKNIIYIDNFTYVYIIVFFIYIYI